MDVRDRPTASHTSGALIKALFRVSSLVSIRAMSVPMHTGSFKRDTWWTYKADSLRDEGLTRGQTIFPDSGYAVLGTPRYFFGNAALEGFLRQRCS